MANEEKLTPIVPNRSWYIAMLSGAYSSTPTPTPAVPGTDFYLRGLNGEWNDADTWCNDDDVVFDRVPGVHDTVHIDKTKFADAGDIAITANADIVFKNIIIGATDQDYDIEFDVQNHNVDMWGISYLQQGNTTDRSHTTQVNPGTGTWTLHTDDFVFDYCTFVTDGGKCHHTTKWGDGTTTNFQLWNNVAPYTIKQPKFRFLGTGEIRFSRASSAAPADAAFQDGPSGCIWFASSTYIAAGKTLNLYCKTSGLVTAGADDIYIWLPGGNFTIGDGATLQASAIIPADPVTPTRDELTEGFHSVANADNTFNIGAGNILCGWYFGIDTYDISGVYANDLDAYKAKSVTVEIDPSAATWVPTTGDSCMIGVHHRPQSDYDNRRIGATGILKLTGDWTVTINNDSVNWYRLFISPTNNIDFVDGGAIGDCYTVVDVQNNIFTWDYSSRIVTSIETGIELGRTGAGETHQHGRFVCGASGKVHLIGTTMNGNGRFHILNSRTNSWGDASQDLCLDFSAGGEFCLTDTHLLVSYAAATGNIITFNNDTRMRLAGILAKNMFLEVYAPSTTWEFPDIVSTIYSGATWNYLRIYPQSTVVNDKMTFNNITFNGLDLQASLKVRVMAAAHHQRMEFKPGKKLYCNVLRAIRWDGNGVNNSIVCDTSLLDTQNCMQFEHVTYEWDTVTELQAVGSQDRGNTANIKFV